MRRTVRTVLEDGFYKLVTIEGVSTVSTAMEGLIMTDSSYLTSGKFSTHPSGSNQRTTSTRNKSPRWQKTSLVPYSASLTHSISKGRRSNDSAYSLKSTIVCSYVRFLAPLARQSEGRISKIAHQNSGKLPVIMHLRT